MLDEALPTPSTGQALARRADALSAEAWEVMRQQAAMLVKTHFLPKGVDTPEKAIAIMLKGRELGVPAMYALSNIAVINGKPTAGAELMLSLIYRDHGDDAIRVVDTTDQRCTIAYRRRGWEQPELFTFTIEEAERAGLIGKDNWRNYPAAMLRARCISAVARLAFPDTIAGLYTPDEVTPTGRAGSEHVVREDPAPYPGSAPPPGESEVVFETVDQAPRVGETATESQLATIEKLSRLLEEPASIDQAMDRATAADLIRRLSRRFNELDATERGRRSRGAAGVRR